MEIQEIGYILYLILFGTLSWGILVIIKFSANKLKNNNVSRETSEE